MAHAHDSVFLNVCVLNVDIKLCFVLRAIHS